MWSYMEAPSFGWGLGQTDGGEALGLDTGSFLQRLREETRADHDRVEAAIPVMRADLDVAAYREILARCYGYHAPLEVRLEALSPTLPPALDWPARRKCPNLCRDLAVLGVRDAEFSRLPRCRSLPALSGPARILGCLYVLEGASLGGQVICRHLAGLDPTIARNRRFFQGYGERTGAMWQAFRAVLVDACPRRSDQEAVIEAARDTFRTFAAWMDCR